MITILNALSTLFAETYSGVPELTTRAPGRVNLIGEHTDYNDGFVLPVAIDRATYVAARRRADATINVIAGDLGGARVSFALDEPIAPDPTASWSNYVRGVAAGLIAHGVPIVGADLAIIGDVPQGAGLSSSASLEMACGYALAQLAGTDIDRTALALIGQHAEHEYAGCKCGVMDQLVSARGAEGHALLIDCRSLKTQEISIPENSAIMIVHSGQTRGLVDGAYNTRRAQCVAAAAHFRVAALRDLDIAALEVGKEGLDETSYRRARHVVTENARTEAAARCLAAGDLRTLGQLMAESHASMRDDFEITTPVIDGLVALIQAEIGSLGGARMTGGGFGGAVVAVMPKSAAKAVHDVVIENYKTPSGDEPHIMMPHPSNGVSLL